MSGAKFSLNRLEEYQMPNRIYKYQCVDNSLLTPCFKKRVVKPILRFVPGTVSANWISICSTAFICAGLGVSLIQTETKGSFILCPVLFLLYSIGDHLDGMQAVRTNTCSALGEFCDHFLDTFGTGMVLLAMLVLYHVENVWVGGFLVFTAYLVHAATMYEQQKTGWLYFDSISAFEAMCIVVCVVILGMSDSIYGWFTAEAWKGLSYLEILILLNAVCSLVALFRILRRIGKVTWGFIHYLFTSSILLAFGSQFLSKEWTVFFLIFHNARYIADLIHGHLVDGKERWADSVIPLIAIVFLAGVLDAPRVEFCWGMLFYQIGLVSFAGFRTQSKLKVQKLLWV